MRLYHFTCRHAAEQIVACGKLVPNPAVRPSLVWLTDLPSAPRACLGLTSELLPCDRMECRFEVECEAERYVDWARRTGLSWLLQQAWDTPGAIPMHWYVSEIPVAVST